MHYLYLLYSQLLDRFYIGVTENVDQRLEEHNRGHSAFTSKGMPWKLVYYEAYLNKHDAYQRERALKNHGKGISELKKRLSEYRE